MRHMSMFVACVVLGSLSACILGPGKCVGSALPGLSLSVLDSVTSAPPTVPVSLIITSPSFSDTLPHPGDGSFDGSKFVTLYDRPGTYSLTVRASGYAPWTRSDVVVPADRCGGAITVAVVAKLRPI
jgi:hypothetical protein